MKAMRERGASRIAVILWIMILFVVIHIGVKLVPVYMDAYKMEDEISAKVYTEQVSKLGDDELRRVLSDYAQSIDLPLKPEDIIVVRDENKKMLRISTVWDIEVRFFWGACGESCVRDLHFDIKKEGPY